MNNLSIFVYLSHCPWRISWDHPLPPVMGINLVEVWGGNVTVIGIETHTLSCTGAAKPLWRKKEWKNCKVAYSFSSQVAFLFTHIILDCIAKECDFNPVKHLSHLSIKHQ